MTRGLSSDQTTMLAKRVKRSALFVELQLGSGTIYVWNGVGSLTYGGHTWAGVGDFGIIQGLETNTKLVAPSISIALVDLPGSLITGGIVSSTRASNPQGKTLIVYLAFTDETDYPVTALTAIWSGFADVLSFVIGDRVTIALTAEHFTSKLRQTNGYRMTDQSHNQRLGNPSPRDVFFYYQTRLMGKTQPLL